MRRDGSGTFLCACMHQHSCGIAGWLPDLLPKNALFWLKKKDQYERARESQSAKVLNKHIKELNQNLILDLSFESAARIN
jgi:hypothetical protein